MKVLQQHFLFLWYRTGFKWVFECLYTAGCMEKKHPKTVEKKDVMSLQARIQTTKDSSMSSKDGYKKKVGESFQVHTRTVKTRAGSIFF